MPLMYLVGITLAILITRRRWRALGGDPDLVSDVALWVVPAGIIGGRIYFDLTTPADIPHVWYGVFAVWSGGLGIWGGVCARHGWSASGGCASSASPSALFATPSRPRCSSPRPSAGSGTTSTRSFSASRRRCRGAWRSRTSTACPAGSPRADLHFGTFQPTFLYELIFDFAWAAFLIWLGHHRKIKPPGLFALYVFGYSAYRIFEESLRIDSSVYIFGLRLNMYIASVLAVVGAVWFYRSQRRARPRRGRRCRRRRRRRRAAG